MKQAVLTKAKTIEFSEIEKPVPADNEVLVKVKNVGICGSDIHAFHGKHPFMSFPIRLGHEMSGEIVELGSKVKDLKVGQIITMRPQEICNECVSCKEGRYNICNTLKVIGCQTPGAACEYFNIPADIVYAMPKALDAKLAATVEPAAVGVHAVRVNGGVKGLNVVVMGAGTIGNVTAQAAIAEGAKSVLITDLSDFRLELAKKCGIEHTANTSKVSMEEACAKAFNGEKADVFFECVGVGATVNSGIENVRKGGSVVIVGVFGYSPEVNVGLIQDREISVVGTLMYLHEDFRDAIDYMAAGKINMRPLISKAFAFDDYQKAFEYIEEHKDESIKVMIEL